MIYNNHINIHMKIISWNVNGLRAIWKKGALQDLLEKENPDILILQETKSEVSQLTSEMINIKNYTSYFESAKNRKGYSGVAVYTKISPVKINYTLGVKDFIDNEGRTIMAEYDNFYLMNCYWPNGGKSDEHFQYKLDYYDETLKIMQKLEKKKPVIFAGDINATVADIDLARPKENAGKLGCTTFERDRLKKFCDKFVDTYRYKNGDKIQYTWWDMKTRSREKNVGWRIDYFFTSTSLKDKIKTAKILDQHFGSDHCPIVLELDLK
jgi:exodeoxyribonuclease III